MSIAFVNGDYLPLSEARVSVMDRGFLFADSVYEVIPVYAGVCFRLDDHLRRLARSLAGLRIANPHDLADWQALVAKLIEHNGGGDLSVYIQVSRGAPARREHRLPKNIAPTVVAFCQTRAPVDDAVLCDGIAAVTATDTRWRDCWIKSTSLLANVVSADAARAAGASEALLVRDGAVLEGTSSNVFAVIDGTLVTPGLCNSILPGITRAVVLDLAARHGVDHAEIDRLTPRALATASEIWITSSTREVFAVTRLNNTPVGNGRPGPLWTRMRAALQAMTHD